MFFKKIMSVVSPLRRGDGQVSRSAGGWKKYIIILILLLAIILVGYGLFLWQGANKTISPAQAQIIAEKFINENLLPSTTKVTIKSVTEEYGLYNITLTVGGKDYHSYLTKDGKKFFQSVLDIAEVEKQAQTQTQTDTTNQPAATVAQKTAKPEVELYVMAYCPYGVQMEKGIIPTIEALGNKIDFKLKFTSYSMHGKKELDEQLTQYCINQQDSGKLLAYLTCFDISSDSAQCLTQTGINSTKIKSCVSATDKQYKVTEKFNDQSSWSNGSYPPFDIYLADNQKYNVSGSPTLVINGSTVQANRDSASLLKLICSGFTTVPAECSKVLSSAAPAAGFGQGTTSDTNSSAAGCTTN